MYAVVDSGGKQYRVEPGSTLVVDRLRAEAGATVTFDRVLLIGDDDGVTVGTPTVNGASVLGTVVKHERGPKIIVFRFRPKAHYRRRTGHRSELTRVRIDEIATAAGGRQAATREPAEKAVARRKAAPPRQKAAAAKAATSTPAAPKATASKARAGTKPAAKAATTED
jgi:large subunit ribosomal protein L21